MWKILPARKTQAASVIKRNRDCTCTGPFRIKRAQSNNTCIALRLLLVETNSQGLSTNLHAVTLGPATTLQNHVGHLSRTPLKRKLAKTALRRNESSWICPPHHALSFRFLRVSECAALTSFDVSASTFCVFAISRPSCFRFVDVMSFRRCVWCRLSLHLCSISQPGGFWVFAWLVYFETLLVSGALTVSTSGLVDFPTLVFHGLVDIPLWDSRLSSFWDFLAFRFPFCFWAFGLCDFLAIGMVRRGEHRLPPCCHPFSP